MNEAIRNLPPHHTAVPMEPRPRPKPPDTHTQLPIAERQVCGFTFTAALMQQCRIRGDWTAEDVDQLAHALREMWVDHATADFLIEQALEQFTPWPAAMLARVLAEAGVEITVRQFKEWKTDATNWANSARGAEFREERHANPNKLAGSKHGALTPMSMLVLSQLHAHNGGVLPPRVSVSSGPSAANAKKRERKRRRGGKRWNRPGKR